MPNPDWVRATEDRETYKAKEREAEREAERTQAAERLSPLFQDILDGLPPDIKARIAQAKATRDGANQAREIKKATDGAGDVLTKVAGIALGHYLGLLVIKRNWNKHLVPLGLPPVSFMQLFTACQAAGLFAQTAAGSVDSYRGAMKEVRDAVADFKRRRSE